MHSEQPILQARGVKTYFPIRTGILRKITGYVYAVDGVDFDLYPGETLGLVGESGCGKTTLARTVIRLVDPTEGSMEFRADGTSVDLAALNHRELKPVRRHIQYIFQDPFNSLNVRMTIERVLAEPLVINRIGTQKTRRDRAVELLERVGLNEGMLNRFPNEFSGGQRQRIVVARALALNPKIILCDEPVSALDVSIQAQVLNLLEDLQDEFGFSYLFIAHDLSVVDHISDRIMVMYLGRIVERGGRDDIYQRPTHPYTEALLSSIPVPDPRTRRHGAPLSGGVPDPSSPPQGCHFHPRCAYAVDECKQTDPALEPVPDADDVQAACIRKHELELEGIPPVKSKKRRTKMSELRRRMTESG